MEKKEDYILKTDSKGKNESKKDYLSPFFGGGPQKKEKSDVGEKSHHEFLKISQENKFPLGKSIDKKEFTKEEVEIRNSYFLS